MRHIHVPRPLFVAQQVLMLSPSLRYATNLHAPPLSWSHDTSNSTSLFHCVTSHLIRPEIIESITRILQQNWIEYKWLTCLQQSSEISVFILNTSVLTGTNLAHSFGTHPSSFVGPELWWTDQLEVFFGEINLSTMLDQYGRHRALSNLSLDSQIPFFQLELGSSQLMEMNLSWMCRFYQDWRTPQSPERSGRLTIFYCKINPVDVSTSLQRPCRSRESMTREKNINGSSNI